MTFLYTTKLLPLVKNAIAFVLVSFLSLTAVAASNETKHSFQSCTIITTELLTTAQLYGRGIPLESLIESLPDLTPEGEKKVRSTYSLINKTGLISTYSAINSDYAKCAKKVYSHQGKPAYKTREYGYYFCSGENKLRYEIILAIFLKRTREEVIPQIPKSRQRIAAHYFKVAESDGLEAVFDLMASSLKHCVTQINPL